MQLSSHLQSRNLLASIASMRLEGLRDHIAAETREWYAANPGERALIATNLVRLGIELDGELCDQIISNVGLHYFEKLAPLCLGPKRFREFLDTHVDSSAAAATVAQACTSGTGVLLAAGHFGAVEFIAPSLSTHRLALTAALKFKTEQFSQAANAHAKAFAESGLFSPIAFIEVGKPGTHAALDMAAVLRRKEVLLSVFDERTDYSVAVDLFATRVWGGAGLDKLVAFAGAGAAVFTAFMVRGDFGTYRLELDPLDSSRGDFVRQMYAHLQRRVRAHPEQWYFLHEEVPFVEGEFATAAGATNRG